MILRLSRHVINLTYQVEEQVPKQLLFFVCVCVFLLNLFVFVCVCWLGVCQIKACEVLMDQDLLDLFGEQKDGRWAECLLHMGWCMCTNQHTQATTSQIESD